MYSFTIWSEGSEPVRWNPPAPTTADAFGQHLVDEVDLFFKRQPLGNDKNWNDLTARLARWVQRCDPKLSFDGLLWVLEHHTRYQYQSLAGELLGRTSLPCPIPLDELLRRVLPGFEESAHSVPAYIRRVFGRDAVLASLRRLEDAGADSVLMGKIRTMRWWMGADAEAF